jgi:hypothetical protein
MTRLHAYVVAAGLGAGAVGCAHCSTCDDFPAPCVGPNCGGGPNGAYAMASGPAGYPAPTGMVVAPPSGASLGPVNDAAGPAPTVPNSGGSIPAAPPIESKPSAPSPTPPAPGDPLPRPGA